MAIVKIEVIKMTLEETLKDFIVTTKERFEETDRKFQQTKELLSEKFQETDKKFQETKELLSEKFQETDRKFQETDKKFQETKELLSEKFQETDKNLRKLEGLFTSQWGKLIEALVRPSALRLFQERGINITQTMQRVEIQKGNLRREFDIILVDGDIAVVVEVKTTLKVDDINEHLDDLKNFTKIMPQYQGYKIYGAVAYINSDEGSDRHAYREGLFVITLSGEGVVKIKNDLYFTPVDFS